MNRSSTRFFTTLAAAIGLSAWLCEIPGNAAEILFIGGQGEATQGDDGFAFDHLEVDLGHTVTYVQASQSLPSDADGMDLIILSSTPGSGDMRGKFNDLETPILNWEEALVRWNHGDPDGNFRLSEASGGGLQSDTINIVNPDHCLAAGFPEGELVIADAFDDKPDLGLELAAGLIVIAEVDPTIANDTNLVAIAAIETGGILGPDSSGDELPSPGPRVNFPIRDTGFGSLNDEGLALFDAAIEWLLNGGVCGDAPTRLEAGDADQDLKFDQLDLVQVQVAAKYLTGQAATWGEGDWDAAPGGEPGTPPMGDGQFNQLDIIAALNAGKYLTGPYAAIAGEGQGDGNASITYDPATGELGVQVGGTDLTSINIDSAAAIFTGAPAENLGGSFDNDADNNIFKATFGSSFGSLSFGNVAQAGLSEDFVLNDLSVIGSLAGGGDLGSVDLIYVPEPSTIGMLLIGMLLGLRAFRRLSESNRI